MNKILSSVKLGNSNGMSSLINFRLFSIGVATTDLYGQCTLKHSGTSAAAPEAAGVFALVLEAKYEINKN
jgi:subtilisin family serine protease